MKWIFLTVVVIANCAAVFLAVAPGLVTYAEIAPKEITCSLCGSPEVQSALIAAVKYGRSSIQLDASSVYWLLGIGLFNVVAFSLVLFIRGSSNNSLKSDVAKPRALG